MSTPQQPPADWYPDPYTPGVIRYWDGAAWTAHTAPGAAPAAPAAYYPGALRLSPGVSTQTVWFWLVILLPLAVSIVSFALPWADAARAEALATLSDPTASPIPLTGYNAYTTLANLASLVVYALGIVFAYLDFATLRNRGIDRPFHWAWQFLNPVYPIGRLVVTIRRTGRGWGLLAAFIVATLISWALTAIVLFQIFAIFIDATRQLSPGSFS